MEWLDNFLPIASIWIQAHPGFFLFITIFMLGSAIAVTIHEVDPLFKLEMKWSDWKSKRKKYKKQKDDERLEKLLRKSKGLPFSVSLKQAVPSHDGKLAGNKPMNDLWSPDSLRGLYLQSKQKLKSKDIAVSVRSDIGFLKKLALKINAKTEGLVAHDKKVKELRRILDNIICPHCLKTITTREISFTCPFCDRKYFESGTKVVAEDGDLIDNIGAAIITKMNEDKLLETLFGECKCRGKIQYLSCHHCDKEIDLFSPYDYEAIERRRYGR